MSFDNGPNDGGIEVDPNNPGEGSGGSGGEEELTPDSGGSGGGGGGSPPPDPGGDSEASDATDDGSPRISDRRRVMQLEQRIMELEKKLQDAQQSLTRAELRNEIDAALIAAKALDLETARLVVEYELMSMDGEDIQQAITKVQAGKPFLFAGTPAHRAGSPATTAAGLGFGPSDDLAQIADGARETGDRRELMRYLRARRGN